MIEKKRVTFFEILVYVAYGYFILVGLTFFSLYMVWGGEFSYWAFSMVLVFGIQAWFRHILTNLILGVITLAGSIFSTLECVARGHKTGFNSFVGTLTALSVLGVIFSIILLFSYTKLKFKDQ